MLYKIEEGVEEKDKYGIALARVMPFPEPLLSRAAVVSEALRKQSERREDLGLSPTMMLERRRKLILNLKEQLLQLRAAAAAAAANPAFSVAANTKSSDGVDDDSRSFSDEDTASGSSITDAMLTTRLKELRKTFVLDMTALMDSPDDQQ